MSLSMSVLFNNALKLLRLFSYSVLVKSIVKRLHMFRQSLFHLLAGLSRSKSQIGVVTNIDEFDQQQG